MTTRRVEFRALETADLPMLHEWLSRPHVVQWWTPTPTRAEVDTEYGAIIDGTDPTRVWIAQLDGEPIGYIQSYRPVDTHGDGWWLDEHDEGVRGIDQFLADSTQLGQGIGTAMVRAFVEKLFEDPRVTRIQTDPSPANGRAIRCYEKAGFRAVREIDTPDGAALLMYCDRKPR